MKVSIRVPSDSHSNTILLFYDPILYVKALYIECPDYPRSRVKRRPSPLKKAVGGEVLCFWLLIVD